MSVFNPAFLLIISGMFFLWGCHSKLILPADEYCKWVEDPGNDLSVEKKIEDLNFTLQYTPPAYVWLVQGGKNPKEIEKLKDLQYFTFKITDATKKSNVIKKDVSSAEEYYARVEYFYFKMQNDIYLIDGSDTLPCATYHLEPTYNMRPFMVMTLGFAVDLKKQKVGSNYNKTLIYNDRIFGCGPVLLTIEGEALSNLPELKL